MEIAPLRNKEINKLFSTATSDDFWQKCCFLTQNMLIKNSFKVCDCVKELGKCCGFCLQRQKTDYIGTIVWLLRQQADLSLTEWGNHPLNTLSWCVVKIYKNLVYCHSYKKIITNVSKTLTSAMRLSMDTAFLILNSRPR